METVYLDNYALLEELPAHLEQMGRSFCNYDYVAVMERRFFNIFTRFQPDKRFLTGNGLLLRYKEIAQYYSLKHRMPKILILDDSMVQGVVVGCFLKLFRSLLESVLSRTGVIWNMADYDRFVDDFKQAVTVRLYGQNKNGLIIEKEYVENVDAKMQLSVRDLHDLTMQLSNALSRWNVANTTFSCSIENLGIIKWMISAADSKTQSGKKSSPRDWRSVKWDEDGAQTVMFLCERNSVLGSVIGTVYCFPQRAKRMVVSTPLFLNSIENDKIDDACDFCARVLKIYRRGNNEYKELISILEDQNQLTTSARTQLLCTFLSAIILRSFLEENQIGNLDYSSEINAGHSDFDKVGRNYGYEAAGELKKLFGGDNREIAAMLEKVLGFSKPSEPELFDEDEVDSETLRANEAAVRDNIHGMIGRLAAGSDRVAYQIRRGDYVFAKETETNRALNEVHNKRSMSLEFLKESDQKLLSGYIAEVVTTVNKGIVGIRIGETDNSVQMVLKAGEMAGYCVLEKYMGAVPALSFLESQCSRLSPLQKYRLFERFLEKTKEDYRTGKDKDRYDRLVYMLDNLKENLMQTVALMDYGNVKFSDWNFYNATRTDDDNSDLMMVRKACNDELKMFDVQGSILELS